jgi:hypothetical protein
MSRTGSEICAAGNRRSGVSGRHVRRDPFHRGVDFQTATGLATDRAPAGRQRRPIAPEGKRLYGRAALASLLVLYRLVLPIPGLVERQAGVALELDRQRGIDDRLLILDEEEPVGIARGLAPELDRHKDERGAQRLAAVGLVPLEEARGDVQDP